MAASNIVVRFGIDGLLEKAFSLLGEVIINRLGFRKTCLHFEENLLRLVQNLEKLEVLLPEAEKKAESSSSLVLDFLERILKLCSRAGDLLSECAYDVRHLKPLIQGKKHCKVRNSLYYFRVMMLRRVVKISCRIVVINLSLEKIYHESATLGLGVGLENRIDTGAELEEAMRKDYFSAIRESQSSNYGADAELVKQIILDSGEERNLDLGIISIVGMGGIGKTTIAGQVYRDLDVANYFDERLWVSVPEDFNESKILKGMLQSMTRTTCTLSGGIQAILQELSERLRGKRFFLSGIMLGMKTRIDGFS